MQGHLIDDLHKVKSSDVLVNQMTMKPQEAMLKEYIEIQTASKIKN